MVPCSGAVSLSEPAITKAVSDRLVGGDFFTAWAFDKQKVQRYKKL